jgi:hypothetical protein
MRPGHYFLFSLVLLLSFVGQARAVPTNISAVTVTDVTPNSFAVVWNGDQASLPSLRVYTDENGTQEITEQLTITAYPLKGTHTSVREAARDNGVLLARASGLAPAVTYYFQTVTFAADSGEITLWPQAAPFSPVTTQDNSVRTTTRTAGETLFTNDTILINTPLEDGSLPAVGTIVSLQVAGSSYPVTGIVGDGVTVPFAAMDSGNVFDAVEHLNMPLSGGEEATVTRFLGVNGTETFRSYLLPPRQLAEQRGSVGLYEVVRILQITTGQPDVSLDLDYDINNDDRLGMEESVYFLQIMADLR